MSVQSVFDAARALRDIFSPDPPPIDSPESLHVAGHATWIKEAALSLATGGIDRIRPAVKVRIAGVNTTLRVEKADMIYPEDRPGMVVYRFQVKDEDGMRARIDLEVRR